MKGLAVIGLAVIGIELGSAAACCDGGGGGGGRRLDNDMVVSCGVGLRLMGDAGDVLVTVKDGLRAVVEYDIGLNKLNSDP